MKSIEVKISPIGSPSIEAKGFNGQGCKEATKGLEEALSDGSGTNEVIEKPEIHNVDMEQTNTTQLGGSY